MNTRRINKIAILGSGLMGSSIACHFAGAGFQVLLLDLAHESTDKNKIVREALDRCIKAKPSNIFHKNFTQRITIGNYDEDLDKLVDCDWIMEVVVEKLDVKKSIYEKIEKHRRAGSLITSNTSGIPIHLLTEGRSADFKVNFCGTHFFNPPRYLKLLELIPTVDTSEEVITFLQHFGTRFLGKTVVLCKDTPAFIANRIGVPVMAKIFELAYELNLNIGEVDKLTGPALGRPKSGTFRLTDLVGLDTAMMVIQGLKQNCPNDLMIQALQLPPYLKFLMDNKFYGQKSGKGFFNKTEEKDEFGKNVILALDLQTHEYRQEPKTKLESIQISKQIEDLPKRLRALIKCNDAGGELVRKSLGYLFAYSAQRIPEIADHFFSIDLAMKNGFGWDLGPFESWDAVGFESGIELIHGVGLTEPDWVKNMSLHNASSFYKQIDGRLSYWDLATAEYTELPGQTENIQLRLLEEKKIVFKNPEINLYDIGDGVLCLEFRSKYNAIGEGILTGIQESILLAETQGWKGIVIGNNAANFTVGANLMLIGMMAFQQDYDQLDMAVRLFQNTSMRCRYSSIPVVTATQGYVFGGGTELLMHCDAAVCSVESYIGLVEVGVGLLPGGGGTKEFALRLSDQLKEGEVHIPQLIEKFKTIAMAAVATSAYEAFDYGYLLAKRDQVSINGNNSIFQAKQKVLQLNENYIAGTPRKDVMVLGRSGLAALYTGANSLKRGNYASEHDIKIAKKIAYVLCGGDLSSPQKVSEQYLLDIEREAFLSLCSEPKTLERIQYMLENNKPLRN
ncbi:MAG: 3-hydroxyacyl-CoA dehydrogenase/enoyl-CoA hydratase family protein [Saprospiraceae bacterium]|nr:3-hydroxyacyl-CoA dehydrogenase/enoyl-CoA hydratase family protein [Candidatus Vicinibacter affinis]MBK8405939.1 3-hydroxyacyl-CoA dehydrogenase/enoyl-CoA hydratase family protein [Candidatus Vicinibacter affinis]MBK8642156.1 3-hydroxyacyl-CoA dehydrogenase/enoyl-CoA hydratase family protein [Candidatus Vicinibacter affinis]